VNDEPAAVKYIQLSDIPALAQVFQSARDYLVRQPGSRSFPFVYQWHARALPEEWTDKDAKLNLENGANEPVGIHGDLRMERPDGQAIGWTLFTPGTQKKADKFLKGQATQGTMKEVHEAAWLGFRGRIEKGNPGATREHDGFVLPIGKGFMTYGTQKPGFHEYFLKFSDPKLSSLNGRWLFKQTAGMWQVERPKEQQPYVDTHSESVDRGSQLELWQYSPVSGLDIPRAAEPKSEAAQAAGPGKAVLAK